MGCSVFVPKGWQLKILEVNTSRERNPASFRGLTSLAPFLCRNYPAHGQKPWRCLVMICSELRAGLEAVIPRVPRMEL